MRWQAILEAPCPYCAAWIGPHEHSVNDDGTLGILVRDIEEEPAMSMRQPRRLALLLVTPELFIGMCQNGLPVCRITRNPLPKDTRFVSVAWHRERQCIALTVESDSFDLVAPGDPLPEVETPMFGSKS